MSILQLIKYDILTKRMKYVHFSPFCLQGRIIRGAYRFQAVITTFEMILGGCPELNAIEWRCVIIDEAHRLKNKNCKLLEGFKLMNLVDKS